MCSQYIKNIHTAYIHVISRFAMCWPLNMLPWFGNSEPKCGCPDSALCTLPITLLSIFQLHALLRTAPVLLSCWDRSKWPEIWLFRCFHPINIMKNCRLDVCQVASSICPFTHVQMHLPYGSFVFISLHLKKIITFSHHIMDISLIQSWKN